jgi:hypothetical protein
MYIILKTKYTLHPLKYATKIIGVPVRYDYKSRIIALFAPCAPYIALMAIRGSSSTYTIQARGRLIITMKDNKTIEIVFLKNESRTMTKHDHFR